MNKEEGEIHAVASVGSNKPVSHNWSDYSDSNMSLRHVKREDLSVRTSTWILTAANIAKMLAGISYLSVSMSISIVGIYTSLIGFAYVLVVNAYTLWLTIKTRNRFKHEKISDICDLSVKLYGEGARKYFNVLLIAC